VCQSESLNAAQVLVLTLTFPIMSVLLFLVVQVECGSSAASRVTLCHRLRPVSGHLRSREQNAASAEASTHACYPVVREERASLNMNILNGCRGVTGSAGLILGLRSLAGNAAG
jgi:hypothetical protein